MRGSWLKVVACCLGFLCASPAGATEPAAASAPFVVLERADWVRVLEQVDYLTQDRANLDRQLAQALQEIKILRDQVHEQAALIEQFEAQVRTANEKEAVLDQERQRLQAERDRTDFWSRVKDYGLVGLGAIAVVLAIL